MYLHVFCFLLKLLITHSENHRCNYKKLVILKTEHCASDGLLWQGWVGKGSPPSVHHQNPYVPIKYRKSVKFYTKVLADNI